MPHTAELPRRSPRQRRELGCTRGTRRTRLFRADGAAVSLPDCGDLRSQVSATSLSPRLRPCRAKRRVGQQACPAVQLSSRRCGYQRRFATGGSRQRRIGIVALARKLLIALWRYVDQAIVPEGARLKVTLASVDSGRLQARALGRARVGLRIHGQRGSTFRRRGSRPGFTNEVSGRRCDSHRHG
jgi:hypothetical protein